MLFHFIHILSPFFSQLGNDPWIIHELRLVHIRGLAGEDVVFHLESRCNEEDALRSARLKGKKCRK